MAPPRLLFLLIGAALASAQSPQSQRYSEIPSVPTPPAVVDAMLTLANLHKGDILMDLGSGDGRIVIAAAKQYGIEARGVEIDPQLVRISERNARQAGVSDKVKFLEGDLFESNIREASVVTIYLLPGVNIRLKQKLLRELKPGARLISHRFDMGNWEPDKTVEINGDTIFLWTIPAKLK